MTIMILDEIVVQPGQAAAYRRAHAARYRPAAERRGLTLEHAWQGPAGRDWDDLPVALYYLWSVPDVAAWWAQRLSRTEDGGDERWDKLAFWQEVAPLTLSRRRSTLSPQPDAG